MERCVFLLLFAVGITAVGAQTSRYIDVEGGRLYCEVSGRGQPVVLVHGFTLDSRMWAPQKAALNKRFQVICYDVRGFGRSSRAAGPYDPAADLLALLDTLRIERAHLVGLSMGANVALHFASRYPERVRKVVAASPNIDGFTDYTPALYAAFGQVFGAVAQQGWNEKTQSIWLQNPLLRLQKTSLQHQALVEAMVRDYCGDQLVNPAIGPQYGRPPTLERLPTLQVPVLVLTGEQDEESIQRIARLITQKAPQAQWKTLSQAGHLCNLDRPTAFNRAVRSFLKKH